MNIKSGFSGMDGFVWWIGCVENRHDPMKLGRVQVRIHGWHSHRRSGASKDPEGKIKTEDLPWATVVQPPISPNISGFGLFSFGLVEGSWVYGFFRDGDSAQEPIIAGSFIGRPEDDETLYDKKEYGFADKREESFEYNGDSEKDGEEKDIRKFYPRRIIKIDSSSVQNGWGYLYSEEKGDEKTDGDQKPGDAPPADKSYPETYPIKTERGAGEIQPSLRAKKDTVYNSETENEAHNDVSCLARNDNTDIMDKSIVKFKRDSIHADVPVADIDTDKMTVKEETFTRNDVLDEYVFSESSKNDNRVSVVGHVAVAMEEIAWKEDYKNDEKWPTVVGIFNGREVDWKTYNSAELSEEFPLLQKPAYDPAIDYDEKEYKNNRHNDSWSEPKTFYGAIYPFNKVLQSESGHVVEFDDTPGRERIHIWHRTGTFFEIYPNGDLVKKVAGNNYSLVCKDDHVHVEGGSKITVDQGVKILVNADVRDKEGVPVPDAQREKRQQYGSDYEIEIGAGGDLNIQVDAGHVNINVLNGNVNTHVEKGNVYTYVKDGDMRLETRNESGDGKRGNMEFIVDGNFKQVVGGNYSLEVLGEKASINCHEDCEELEIKIKNETTPPTIKIDSLWNKEEPEKGYIKLN